VGDRVATAVDAGAHRPPGADRAKDPLHFTFDKRAGQRWVDVTAEEYEQYDIGDNYAGSAR
jgi:hypothetical protein